MARKDSSTKALKADGARTEFARTDRVRDLYGIARPWLYELWHARKIKGLLLRVGAGRRGVRLWDCNSVRNFLEAQVESQSQERV